MSFANIITGNIHLVWWSVFFFQILERLVQDKMKNKEKHAIKVMFLSIITQLSSVFPNSS